MEFKIDTKEIYTVISPLTTALDDILAGELIQKCHELRQIGSNNLIIDLQAVSEIDQQAIARLVQLHEESYSAQNSMVITQTTDPVMQQFREHEADLLLNVAPRMIEAIDIVSMEVLERDLLSEE